MPGSIFPQRSHRRGAHAGVDRRPPHRRARARPARVLRGLRLPVVRGDLPAALHLAHRVRAAPHADPLAPGALGTAAGARAASTGSPRTSEADRRGRAARRCASGCARRCAAAATACTPTTTRRSSAEKGYLRETGNLVFHVALIVVIVGVAMGPPVRLEGRRHRAGRARPSPTRCRATTPSAPGPWVDVNDLGRSRSRSTGSTPRSRSGPRARASSARRATSRRHDVTDADGGPRGRAASGSTTRWRPAAARCSCSATATPRSITVRDADGTVLYCDATPFLPQDNNYTSVGAVKVAGASPKQLGFAGFFLPTGQHRRPGPALGLPRRLEPAAGADRLRGRPVPRRVARSRSTRSTPHR